MSASSRAHPRARRRPLSETFGRVRADVRLAAGGGYQRYFARWDEVGRWLASPEYLTESPGVTSVRLLHLGRDAKDTA
jgi:hypothetical protein